MFVSNYLITNQSICACVMLVAGTGWVSGCDCDEEGDEDSDAGGDGD